MSFLKTTFCMPYPHLFHTTALCYSTSNWPRRPKSFCFEIFWTRMLRFKDVISNAWQNGNHHMEPFHRMNCKLATMALRLRAWSKTLFFQNKL